MSDKNIEKNGVNLERLRKLIDTKTREEIARRLECDTSLVTKHYNGKREVTAEYVVKYARYFGVSADYLLGISEYKTPMATEEGKIIREIEDYTGLNEQAVEKLHSIAEPLSEKAEDCEFDDFFITEEMFYERREWILKKLSVVNYFLSSDSFFDAVCFILSYIDEMEQRTTAIYNKFDEALLNDISPMETIARIEKYPTFRLQYFEATENLKMIIDNFTETVYKNWDKAEEKLKFIFDYDSFKSELMAKDGLKADYPTIHFNLTDKEKEELYPLKEKVKMSFLNLVNIAGDSNANDNEAE